MRRSCAKWKTPSTSLLLVTKSLVIAPYRLAWHGSILQHEKKQEQKAAKTLSAILLAFVITWTPYNINVVMMAFCNTCLDNFKFWEAFGEQCFFKKFIEIFFETIFVLF